MNEPILILYTLGALQLNASGTRDKDGSVSLIGKDIPNSVTSLMIDTNVSGWEKFRDYMNEGPFCPGDIIPVKKEAVKECLNLVADDIDKAVFSECYNEEGETLRIREVRQASDK